jgi:hypothetical protein
MSQGVAEGRVKLSARYRNVSIARCRILCQGMEKLRRSIHIWTQELLVIWKAVASCLTLTSYFRLKETMYIIGIVAPCVDIPYRITSNFSVKSICICIWKKDIYGKLGLFWLILFAVRFQAFTAASMKITAFCGLAYCLRHDDGGSTHL